MKRLFKKNQKVVKGMPSAVVLSILIHAALFFLAGLLVVFTVVKKEEQKFVPPKAVERPKMKLRKPKVKVKKSAKPKPTTRIVTKVRRASMPDIQLPEMSGLGENLGGDLGGFDMMPDLDDVSVFGSGQSIGNDFVGTFYDLKRDRSGRNIPMDPDMQLEVVRKFIASGWKPSKLVRYYQSPRNLYATSFMIPPVMSSIAPPLFGEPETAGYLWVVHYTGQLVHKEDITFRFLGVADQLMAVRVGGKEVVACMWNPDNVARILPHWQSSSGDNLKHRLVNAFAATGDWISLKAGVPLDMEVILGEGNGGGFSAMLAVEVKGEEYEINQYGDTIFPMFKTTAPSLDQLDALMEYLVPDAIDPTNGPVFCDYDTSGQIAVGNPEPIDPPVFADSVKNEIRAWSIKEGKALEGEFVTLIGGKVTLKDAHGRVAKIPLDRFSEEDQKYIELARPPKFNIDFSKTSSQVIVETSTPYWEAEGRAGRTDHDYIFGARLKQVSAGEYNHELKVEFFAIGEEVSGDNYILLDRQKSCFTPTREHEWIHEFHGDPVRLTRQDFVSQNIGQKYGGYLVVVTDERGIIVDQGSSHKWLPGILGELRQLPVGKHFDKTGTRVFPPGRKRWY